MEDRIKTLLLKLGSRSDKVAQNAADLLVEIGSAAVEPLLDAIEAKSNYSMNISSRGTSARFTTHGPAAKNMQGRAFSVLTRIGVPALLPLVSRLQHDNPSVRATAYYIIQTIGDAATLPRKVLLDARLTTAQRKQTLETLCNLRYEEQAKRLYYPWPPVFTMCEDFLNDADPDIRRAATEVLDHCQLLRPEKKSSSAGKESLVRAAASTPYTRTGKELLRPSSNQDRAGGNSGTDMPIQEHSWWLRLLAFLSSWLQGDKGTASSVDSSRQL